MQSFADHEFCNARSGHDILSCMRKVSHALTGVPFHANWYQLVANYSDVPAVTTEYPIDCVEEWRSETRAR